jgi:nucleoside phosphorylase
MIRMAVLGSISINRQVLVVTSVVGVVGAADAAADKLFSAKSRTLVILGGAF